jgi:hypothetical protein
MRLCNVNQTIFSVRIVLIVVDRKIYHFCSFMGIFTARQRFPAYRASNPELVVYNS